MAVISHTEKFDNPVSYVATLAFFCCVSCVILMLKFGGFKASLNFYNGKRRKSHKEHSDFGSAVSITGAYRTNRDEFLAYNYPDAQRRVTPSVVPITNADQSAPPLRQVKSTNDLIKDKNLPSNLRLDNPGVSQDPRGAVLNDTRNIKPQDNKTKEIKLDAQKRVDKQRLAEQKKLEKQRLEEHKKIEKQRLEEQKKRDKIAQQEQAKQEKLRKDREKKEAQQAKKDKKKKKQAPPRPVANPLGQASTSTSNNPLAQGGNTPLAGQMQYSTNTLDSSISKTSGPPPYSEVPKPEGEKDSSGNVTYSKPVDTDSWDMVSKHRENINRPVNSGPANAGPTKQVKQTTMDLNYKVDAGHQNKENSEA